VAGDLGRCSDLPLVRAHPFVLIQVYFIEIKYLISYVIKSPLPWARARAAATYAKASGRRKNLDPEPALACSGLGVGHTRSGIRLLFFASGTQAINL
jgi:hypothetical protein